MWAPGNSICPPSIPSALLSASVLTPVLSSLSCVEGDTQNFGDSSDVGAFGSRCNSMPRFCLLLLYLTCPFSVHELKALDVPVKLVWGQYDPYITVAVAERRHSQLKHASLTVVPAGHWLQVDQPAQVAKAMLS
jgi:pimeloyl-ACP methyl ester carboxylesterase